MTLKALGTPYPLPGSQVLSGLANWYKLNEGSGTTVDDSADSYADSDTNDGTINGSVSWTSTSKTGGSALVFSGGDVTMSSNLVDTSGDYTIVAWLSPQSSGTSGRVVFAGTKSKIAWSTQVSGAFSFELFSNANGNSVSYTPPDTSSYYHVAAVHNKSSGMKLYINGTLEDSNSFTGSPDSSTNLAGLAINNGWRGYMDDVRTYARALPSGDIQTIYDNTK